MLNRILSSRQLLRHSLSNYRLLNTSTIVKTPIVSSSLRNNSNFNSDLSTFATESKSSTENSNSVPTKKWARHVISNKPLVDENQSINPPQKQQRRKRRTLKPLKAPITLTENAKSHLRALSSGPNPKLIRISVKNRGCSGLSYHLEYVDKPEKFDEIVTQDDIKVVIDSKALFSIIGSEMDWVDNKLSSKFVFKNPNSKGTCGCGESFMV